MAKNAGTGLVADSAIPGELHSMIEGLVIDSIQPLLYYGAGLGIAGLVLVVVYFLLKRTGGEENIAA
jgi:hypothetical protein